VRRAPYEAAAALLTRYKRKDKVKNWRLAVAKRVGHRKAVVAVARKLGVIVRAMWVDGTFYRGDPGASTQRMSPLALRRRIASCSERMHERDTTGA
jgi:transposase